MVEPSIDDFGGINKREESDVRVHPSQKGGESVLGWSSSLFISISGGRREVNQPQVYLPGGFKGVQLYGGTTVKVCNGILFHHNGRVVLGEHRGVEHGNNSH